MWYSPERQALGMEQGTKTPVSAWWPRALLGLLGLPLQLLDLLHDALLVHLARHAQLTKLLVPEIVTH